MAARASARVCATDPSRFAKWGMIPLRSTRQTSSVFGSLILGSQIATLALRLGGQDPGGGDYRHR